MPADRKRRFPGKRRRIGYKRPKKTKRPAFQYETLPVKIEPSDNHGGGDRAYHQAAFSDVVLQQMYAFLQEELYCDFSIKVQGQVFKVHKLVMASSSDYFRAMLAHDMMETREECTDLKSLTVKGMEPLIEYCYTGQLKLTLENIHDVFSAANFLQIPSAVQLCTEFLMDKMTFENAEELLKIGDVFFVTSLKEYYRNYLLKNFLIFVESESFLKCDADTLANYLEDNALETTSESILFHHCLRWYNYDRKNRETDAYKVFERIRMCTDGWVLIHFASLREPFNSNQKCKDILEYNENFMENASKRYLGNNNYRTGVRSTRQTIVQFGGVMETNEEYDTYHDMITQPTNEMCGWQMNHFFHPDLKSWFPCGIVGQWPERLSHQQFVEVNGCGVMVGGYEYHVDGENVRKLCVKDVKMFIAQGTFQLWDMPNLLHERSRHTAVFLDGFIYVIGGKDDRQGLCSVERLDCEAEKWSYVAHLPLRLYDHAAAVCNGKIYVSGGSEMRQIRKYVYCFDPEKQRWKKMADMNCARAGHGMVCLDGFLYVAGGYNGNREALNPDGLLRCLLSVERYSVEENQWTKLSGMRHAITFFQMTVMNGKIVVLGGLDAQGRLTQYMHQYDKDEDRWRIFGELPRPLKNACCGVVTLKLTDTGCMESESDEIKDEYTAIFEAYEEEQREIMQQQEAEDYSHDCIRMMENFDPGDYELDDYDSDYDYDDC